MKILVVEDHSIIAETLAECLRLMGHESEWAADGEAALVRMDAHAHDAVIIDHYMPAMDGLETMRRIRRRWREVPMVLVTAAAAHVVDAMRLEVAGLGRATVERKPYQVAELLSAIEKLSKMPTLEGEP